MKTYLPFIAALTAISLPVLAAQPPRPPGPSVPPTVASYAPLPRVAAPANDPTTLWDVGDWSDAEQLVLERINRTRANPGAETEILRNLPDPLIQYAYTFFLVDFKVMAADLATYAPQPPLAPHRQLLQSARLHSAWMLANAEQTHFEGNVGILERVVATGYPATIVGENIYAAAENPDFAHAGLEVDWGYPAGAIVPTPPGMQEPPGHRHNNHDSRFREAGVGIVYGRNSRPIPGGTETVGPEIHTINFGSRSGATPLVTGVAYFDLDGNQQYDVGEGIPGLLVNVSDSAYHGRTSRAGGYAVPTADGARTITFSGPGLSPVSHVRTIAGGANSKADLRLAYVPPRLTGGPTMAVGEPETFVAAAVPGATGYRWSLATRGVAPVPWTAESGLDGFETVVSPGYDVRSTQRRATGAFAYRLTSPQPVDQTLNFSGTFVGGASPSLTFSILLGYATEYQTLIAELSDDGGNRWMTLWQRSGVSGQTDSSFTRVTVPLAGVAERDFRLRFRYAVGLGPYYNTTDAGEGAFIDDIVLADARPITEVGSGQVAADQPVLVQANAVGEYALAVRPIISERSMAQGPRLVVTAVAGLPVLRFGTPMVEADGRLALPFTAGGPVQSGFILERSAGFPLAWQSQAGATLTSPSAGNHVFRLTPGEGSWVYRIRLP